MFTGVIIGATIVFTQSINIIRAPLITSLSQYQPIGDTEIKAPSMNETDDVTSAWDSIQKEVRRVFTGVLSWLNVSEY